MALPTPTSPTPASPSQALPWPLLAALLLPLGFPGAGLGQDLVGCQLVQGTLQCVPGTTASPQQQIRILEGEIQRDQVLEGAVEQGIRDLGALVLVGDARQGQLLRATLSADRAANLPPAAFHWYRRAPARQRWELISGVSGPTYTPVAGDVAYQIMVIVALPTPSGSQRSASAPVGPVRSAPAGP
ncbi:MAG: hypothetical protein ACKOZW_14530 [Cyanobium sp.]